MNIFERRRQKNITVHILKGTIEDSEILRAYAKSSNKKEFILLNIRYLKEIPKEIESDIVEFAKADITFLVSSFPILNERIPQLEQLLFSQIDINEVYNNQELFKAISADMQLAVAEQINISMVTPELIYNASAEAVRSFLSKNKINSIPSKTLSAINPEYLLEVAKGQEIDSFSEDTLSVLREKGLLQKIFMSKIEEGQDFTLSEEILEYKRINRQPSTIDDLLMVHVTDFEPKGAIKSPHATEKSIIDSKEVNVRGEKKTINIPLRSYRDTVHFCLNGVVRSHEFGNWDKKKYAIFMPLASNKEKIVAGTECDLFSMGSVEINDTAYILCPEEELEKIKQDNPSAKVIGFKGDNAVPYCRFMINFLGYAYKEPNERSTGWGYGQHEHSKIAESIIKENGWQYVDHNGSAYHNTEDIMMMADYFASIMKFAQDNLFDSNINIDEITEFVQNILGGYWFGLLFNSLNMQISLPVLSNELGINIDNIDKLPYVAIKNDEATRQIMEKIVRAMKIKTLEDKKDKTSEEEKFELKCLKELDEDVESVAKEKAQVDWTRFEELFSKPIDELTDEEREIVFIVLNLKLQHISKEAKENNINLNLRQYDEFPEYKGEYGYSKHTVAGAYMSASMPENNSAYYTNAKTDKQEFEKQAEEMVSVADNHILSAIRLYDGDDIYYRTDFDFEDCKTVQELNERIMQYAQAYSRLIMGEPIQFDRSGKPIQRDVISMADITKNALAQGVRTQTVRDADNQERKQLIAAVQNIESVEKDGE